MSDYSGFELKRKIYVFEEMSILAYLLNILSDIQINITEEEVND